LAKGAAWLAATRVVVNIASFANTLLLARLLVPADFGLVALATTATTIITSVTELSLASALVQHKDPTEDHFHTAWTLNFVRSSLICVVISALAEPIAWLYGDPRLVPILLIIAATTLFGGLLNPKLVIFSRDLIFRQEFVLGVSQRIAGLVVATVVVLIYRSYWALIAGMMATQLVALLVSYLLKPYRPRLKMNRVRELLSFSVWLTLAQVVNTLNYKFDQLVIGYFLGSASLGYYTVGDSLAVLPTREATTPLAQTLFPGFVQLSSDRWRLRHAYQRAQAVLCAVGLPIGFGFAAVARPLILLTMGPKWLPAVFIIQYLSCIFALQTLSSTLQPLAMAVGETRRLFGRDVLNLVLRLPLVVGGLYADGLAGIVYARCISGMLSSLINMIMVRRLLDLSLLAQLAANKRSLVSVVLMMAIMHVTAGMVVGDSSPLLLAKIAAMTATGGLGYVGALYVLWRGSGQPPGPESEMLHVAARILMPKASAVRPHLDPTATD
jgi:lipopolysaccharide exporter